MTYDLQVSFGGLNIFTGRVGQDRLPQALELALTELGQVILNEPRFPMFGVLPVKIELAPVPEP